MERLTEKVYGFAQIKKCGNDFCKETCVEHDEEKSCNNCPIQKAIEKLTEYEDLEEQGKLLKLPCKIGDKIFVIPSKTNYRLNIVNGHKENNRVYEQIVNRIEISEHGYWLSTCDGMAGVSGRSFKETWFLTREEADTALKELGK